MQYDFDRVIDRSNSCSIKHEPLWRGKPADVLPLWVADMDFAAPPCVQDALIRRAEHGIFGYSEPDENYFDVAQKWFEERFSWTVQRDWLTITPGVVNALYIAVRALTEPGDGVVIQQPVYYPFESCVRKTERQLLVNELVYNGGRYGINFEDFEEKIKRAKMFIMCNPHNPIGRVWTKEELTRMGELCLRHNVKVIADEIHEDFVFPDRRHLVFAALNQDFADIAITCTSPSKTFNLAGLLHANIFISNKNLREKFKEEYARCGLSQPGVMGLAACKAAYQGGGEWLKQLLDYLAENMSLLKTYLSDHIPKIKLVEPEGTYLAWLDCNELGLSPQKLDETLTQRGKLWLSAGYTFGQGGKGFERMNVACPRIVLRNALERLKSVDWK
ncbi:MAG: pyridoxal phosphate-dependent aminotransferase [Helicobacteraceae bacterium]|jgi:cystathionine beta-lyase|nr:pyridoxal phosphate-dependent aminotransferase [Helicobacteraceae bacterium]